MLIRDYEKDDAAATLKVFERAITVTGRAGYTEEQVGAWLGAPRELAQWNAERLRVHTVVADLGGPVAGFADMDEKGYVDRLFVDPKFGRRGIAHAMLLHVRTLAEQKGLLELSTHASLVARPVFERAGFRVVHEEVVPRADQALVRFFMRAPLAQR